MHERMEKVNEILEKDLKEKMDKIIAAGTISPEDMKILDCAVDLMLDFKNYEEWEMKSRGGNSYSGEYNYNDGYSNRRGRNMVTGRYTSMDNGPKNVGYSNGSHYTTPYYGGYSGHGNSTIESLRMMYENAPNEHERQRIGEMIERYEMG